MLHTLKHFNSLTHMRFLIASLFLFNVCLLHAQTDEELGLHSEGGPWQFHREKNPKSSKKNVLLIGDSVMNGFHKSVSDSLSKTANMDYWLTPKHLNSEHLFKDLEKVVSSKKYDVIQFNIGLHGWPEGRIKEGEYVPQMEKYVEILKTHAPDAVLIWASTTPVTEQGKAELNKEINPTIVKRNKLAAEVMAHNNIVVNDLYGLVADKLNLARLDRFHWNGEAYLLMADQSFSCIKDALGGTNTNYNVLWESPSKNATGSMPSGNGDMGVNLWVEENGDLLFYLSKTDAWSENGRLLKVGKVRLSLRPNPFETGKPFSQELVLQDGMIQIAAGKKGEQTTIAIWVDANHPVVELDVKSEIPLSAKVTSEPWRTERRQISNQAEIHSAYGFHGKGGMDVFVEKDVFVDNQDNGITWLHRNNRSFWKANLSLQGLDKYAKQNTDPLLHRTFGASIRSKELEKTGKATIESGSSLNEFSISVYALTSQTKTLDGWTQEMNTLANKLETLSIDSRLAEHKNWWNSFWDRSYIHVSAKGDDKTRVFNVARAYALQRYMNACSGRGNSPIKFNGSIFTVDTKQHNDRFGKFDADYRQWGGCYWWQNTRLPYWSMLEAGDYDLMHSLFDMYKDALAIRKEATGLYYGHKGAFFPETMHFWGTFNNANYGRDRSELPLGMTENRFIRQYWQSGLEISLMMLDYYSFTKDEKYFKETLLPVITEVITFYDQHWGRDEQGKILFDPAMALETYNTAVNPLPEIVGINKICSELLRLPESLLNKSQQKQYKRLITELPEIPTKEIDGEEVLIPAHSYSGKQNTENPELYAIFPYRTFGVGKEDLEMARRTFSKRTHKQTGGWQQNAIKAAYLGLTEEAARLTASNFNAGTSIYRFPTMWGPNYDWIPDQCHGTVAMSALQRMLVQYDEDKIYILPAWPKEWDAEFKLYAPQNTIIKGVVKNGKIEELEVFPKHRKKHVIVMLE